MQLVNQSAFLRILGWALLNSVWQMSLLWFIYAIVTSQGKRFSATVRHGVAFSLLSAGCLWFILSLCGDNFLVTQENYSSITSNSYYLVFKKNSGELLPYLSIIYLVILFFLLTRYCSLFLHVYRLKYTGLQKIHPELRIFADEAAQQLGIRRKVNVWLSSVADSPMTVGFLKSVILIPVATINHLSTQQAEAILLHELAHIKRNDYFLNLLVTVTGILFFFNPFARLLIRNIRKETENSCDDLVMQFRYNPHSYASALLSLEKMRNHHQLAMAANGRNNHLLLARVKRITGQPHRFRPNATKIVTLFLFAALAVFTAQFKMQKHDKVLNVEIVDKSRLADKRYFVNTNPAEIINVIIQPLKLQLPDDIKSEKINPEKKKTPESKIVDDGMNENNTDAILASYNEDNGAGEQEDATVTSTADFQPDNDYSVAATSYVVATPPKAPKAVVVKDFPFVPKSSFDFKVTQDTTVPDQYRVELDEKLAEASMTKALAALDKINWNKLKKDISKANKEVDIQKLQVELRKSIAELDWQKINEENPSVITRDDLHKINRDIKIQLQSLQNSQVKNTLQAKVFRKRLMNEQLKLERESLLKQQQLLKKIETTQKHKKIVYI